MCDAFIIKVMLKIKKIFRLKFPNDKFKNIYMQASIYFFFSHAFTIILMNCNVCILQLQKKRQITKKNKQTKTPNKTKKNPKIQKTKHKQTSDCLKI